MSGENVMPKIAAALGVAVNEPFAVCNSQDNTMEWFKVTIDGMQHFAPSTNGFSTLNGIKGDWYHAEYILEPLCIGRRCWVRNKVEQGELFIR